MLFKLANFDAMQIHSVLPFFLIKYFAKCVFFLSYVLMYPIFFIKKVFFILKKKFLKLYFFKNLSAGNVRGIELLIPNNNNNIRAIFYFTRI